MTSREDLQNWLAEELGRPGRSQSGLARFMGLDQSAVNRMVSGRRAIKAHELPVIERYLAGSSEGREANVGGLTGDRLSKIRSPISTFPAVMGSVYGAQSLGLQQLVELTVAGADYPLVLILARDLEQALSEALLKQISGPSKKLGINVDQLVGQGARPASISAVQLLESVHLIGPDDARKIMAMLALRDALTHSLRPLTLLDPAIRELVELIVHEPADSLWRGDGFELRSAFLIGAVVLSGTVRAAATGAARPNEVDVAMQLKRA